jgi:hypothetical protein
VDEEVVVDQRGRQTDELGRDRGGTDVAAGGGAVEDLAHEAVACGEHTGAGAGGAIGVGQGLGHQSADDLPEDPVEDGGHAAKHGRRKKRGEPA